ncbi:Imm1 family immunity protein [Amycolatopsis sp. lyj-84]|uniref:Imm1 family immunity protein n=1 Tax=Amycolatopsis sp. lyj-84 TaxID=2789284 RepID=UPI00397BDEF1
MHTLVVTASLSSGVGRVTRGMATSVALIEEILTIEHISSETTLSIGDIEFYGSKEYGPFPNHQFRVSVRPSIGFAALNYMDHDDKEMPVANSFNPRRPLPEANLIFNGVISSMFPRTAAIPVSDARSALLEWLGTRTRPTCISWVPFDQY